MPALDKFTTELLRPIQRRVYLTSEFALRLREDRNYCIQGNAVSYNHDVNIACGCLGSGSYRSIEERESNFRAEGLKSSLQNIGHPKGLPDKAAKFSEHRATGVGLEVGLGAFHCPDDDPGAGEPCKLTLYCSGSKPG
jgi:hypothetical protein